MTKSNWQDREHSSWVASFWGHAGWEFDTAEQAREYVSDQFSRAKFSDLEKGGFRFHVESNGVQVAGNYLMSLGMRISTKTYRKGATMRELEIVASPSDCVWLIPGSEG